MGLFLKIDSQFCLSDLRFIYKISLKLISTQVLCNVINFYIPSKVSHVHRHDNLQS